MQKITSVNDLHGAIALLESRRRHQEQELEDHFMFLYDSLKPVNLLRRAIRSLAESTGVHHHFLNTVIGILTGYLSREVFVRPGSGPLKKLLGFAMQYGVTNLVRKRGGAIKDGTIRLVRTFLVQRENGTQ